MSDLLFLDGGWPTVICNEVAADRPVVLAMIIAVKGSAPRETGARMVIGASQIWGTIGGGQLEYDAMQTARKMLADAALPEWACETVTAALGPDLGQCCGGQVRMVLTRFDARALPVLRRLEDADHIAHPLQSGNALRLATADEVQRLPALESLQVGYSAFDVDQTVFIAPRRLPTRPLFVYGAGHVGRALVAQLVPLGLDVHWVDIAADRFPASAPDGVRPVPAADPARIALHAPADAFHIVMTHSHALDEAICAAILKRDQFARLGLIGSQTKAARFRRRLATMGIATAQLDRLICPIGLMQITGKSPPHVALSIAAGVALWQQEMASAPTIAAGGPG